MKKIVLVYGGIAGVIVGGMFFATWPLHEKGIINFDNGHLVGYTTMVIALSLIFFAVKSFRDQQSGGNITFGKGLVIGLLITLVAGVLYALTWEIMYNTVASDFMEKMSQHYYDTAVKEGASEVKLAELKQEMQEFSVMYENPIIRFGFTLLEIIPVGIIISLISAGLLRKSPAS
jgi:hypothetical protein